MVVDCQSTGANPRRGSLLEVAWSRGRADDDRWVEQGPVVAHLVRQPRGRKLPARVAALTGLADDDVAAALPPAAVWRRLRAEDPPAAAVAHFARFERTWLEALWRDHGSEEPFPFELLCTHEIVCRLMPGLPRRGLRAVAGYFGHVLGEHRRAEAHVRATVRVWREVVDRLAREHGVTTRAHLAAWLRDVAPARRTGRDFPFPREARLALPDAPGVYRMLGKGGQILYLGKATSLRRRVNSYFQHRRHGGERKREMLTQAFDVEVVVTGSPLEAALAEADEIKRHAPAYNVALRARARSVWFASADLDDVRDAPDRAHRLGPLPRADALAPLAALRLLPTSDEAVWRRALGLPDDRALDPVALREGLARFCDAHGIRFPLARLLRLGARLWRERRERAAAAEPVDGPDEADADETDEPAPPPEGDWPRTPDDVRAALEASVRHATHLVRRARWFVRLCEASLHWRPQGLGPPRVLVLERGAVTYAADADAPDAACAAAPPGAGRARLARLSCFDAATYDRLRVLTTELRRVVAEDPAAELRLGGARPLSGRCLSRRLFWI